MITRKKEETNLGDVVLAIVCVPFAFGMWFVSKVISTVTDNC